MMQRHKPSLLLVYVPSLVGIQTLKSNLQGKPFVWPEWNLIRCSSFDVMGNLIRGEVGGMGRVTNEIPLNSQITVLGSLVGDRNTSGDMPRSCTDTGKETHFPSQSTHLFSQTRKEHH